MNDFQASRLSEVNRQAWDTLYGKTADLVWGSEPVGFLREFETDILSRLGPSPRGLDAATGEGRNLETLLGWGLPVVACDASSHALTKMPVSLARRVSPVISDLYSLPFQNGRFDFVLASDIIETLPRPDVALREICRVMRPGGIMLCNIPGMEDEISAVEMKPIHSNKYLFQDRFFYQFLTEGQSVDLLVSNGFGLVKSKLCSWTENAHPQFRDSEHKHTSRVFLVEKPQ